MIETEHGNETRSDQCESYVKDKYPETSYSTTDQQGLQPACGGCVHRVIDSSNYSNDYSEQA